MATASLTTIEPRETLSWQPRSIDFPEETREAIDKWVDKQLRGLKARYRNLHENVIPEYRRIIDGQPREKNKSFPFPNCSNIVHQLVGEAVDDTAARVLQLIWLTSPLAIFRYLGANAEGEKAAYNSEKAKTLEQFIDYCAMEPRELDLYTKENFWFTESAGLGRAWICVVPENRVEAVYAGYDEKNKRAKFEEQTLYQGPKVVNLEFEDILCDLDEKCFEDCDPIFRKVVFKGRRQLQERVFKNQFKEEPVEKIFGHADRNGPSPTKKRENARKGIAETSESSEMEEWDIYEGYFSWWHNGKKHRLIHWYHPLSRTTLNCVYNFIPDNQIPIVETRLSVNAKGYAEMLRDSQEEVSTAKNQRADAITWGILGINRISPVNKNIDRNFTIWPGLSVPFGKDEFEHFEVANPAMSAVSLQSEQALIQQARERVGIGPTVAGSGSGQVDKKGRYSAMGTLATMQDSNTRASHRQSDFRHSHLKAIGKITDFYGKFGHGRSGALFGGDEKILDEALQDFIARKLRMPLRAATASMNREVTKQNAILLNQSVSGYIKETSQRIQAALNPASPEEYKRWLAKAIVAQTRLMQNTIRYFQLSEQPEEFIPNIDFLEKLINAEQAPAGQRQSGDGSSRIAQMAQILGEFGAGGGAGAAPGVPGAL